MIERLARLGYASKALIYAIVGGLAIAAAANRGGRVTDTSGALRVLLGQPFGRILLVVLTVGLLGYALWRVLDAIKDPDRHGTGFSGLVKRVGHVVRALVYGALGLEAIRLLRGMSGSKSDETRLWTARVMDLPLGDWLVGLAGAVIVIYGVTEVIDSFKQKRDPLVDYGAIPGSYRTALTRICSFGVGSRGAILVVVGIALVRAAFQHDPSEASSTRESMITLAGVVEGRWALGAIGAGLLAYAVDQMVHARYRRIRQVT